MGIVCKKSEHEWTTFVTALHYYAARKTGVPVWCVDLLWEYDPWDEAQLPMSLHIQCNISSVFPDIAEGADTDGRCYNCWEDCEDLAETRKFYDLKTACELSYLRNCRRCGTTLLCDLCKVQLRDGSMCCLYCLVPPPGYRVWPRGYLGPETDEHYHARVAAALAGLTEAQQKRWRLVNSGWRCSFS